MMLKHCKKIITFIITIQGFTCFSDSQYEEKVDMEFVKAVSNAVNITYSDGYKESYVASLRSHIRNLETLLSAEIISYSWDYPACNLPVSIHLKNADELEKIRLMVDCQFQEMILVERLKDLHAKRLEAEKVMAGKAKVCADIEGFFDRLSGAMRIDIDGVFNGESYAYTVVMDKEKIKKLSDIFLNAELKYNPQNCSSRYEMLPLKPDPLPSSKMIYNGRYFCGSISMKIIIDGKYFLVVDGTEVYCKYRAYEATEEYSLYCKVMECFKKWKKGAEKPKGSVP